MIALPWMDRPSRGDNQDALKTIVQLNRLASVNETAALRALALPLLNGPQSPNPLLMNTLAAPGESNPALLDAMMSHPRWTRGTENAPSSDITLAVLEVAAGPGAAFTAENRCFSQYAGDNDPTLQPVLSALQVIAAHAPRLASSLLTSKAGWLLPKVSN